MLLIIYLRFLIRRPPLLNFDSFDSQLCCSGTGYVIDFFPATSLSKQEFSSGCAAQKYTVLYVGHIFHRLVHQYKDMISYVHDM